MTGDRNEADSITGRLERANQERQSIEAAMVTDALDRLAVDRGYADGDPIVVLAAEGWHRGVAGLVAGAIRERYGRPAFVLCIEDGIAVGSARGVDGLSLSDAVDSAGDLISHGGGHAMAAGVTLPAENIGAFRRAVNEYARTVLGNDELAPTHAYEAELEPDQITVRLTNQLQLLAPFGQGNPRPAFVTRGLAVEYAYTFGRQNRHLKIGLSAAGRTINGLLYRRGDRLPEVQPGMRLDVLYTLRTEVRSGVAQLELVLQDMRRSDAA
jgi:single-stranded-DNA-specific exonuclease